MTHPSKYTRSATAEFAYTAEGRGVLTFTMLLPDLNDLQQLTESISIDTPDVEQFRDSVLADFAHGAVTQFFHRDIQAGRWLERIKDARITADAEGIDRITCWIEHSSKFPTAVDTYTNSIRSTNCNDAINRSAIDHFLITTIDRICSTKGAKG